jgi:hypothetical protein
VRLPDGAGNPPYGGYGANEAVEGRTLARALSKIPLYMAWSANDAFVPYSQAGHFAKGALIAHATFGRGVVLAAAGRTIEVQFEVGKKKLSHAG